jgi:hypothetical protein
MGKLFNYFEGFTTGVTEANSYTPYEIALYQINAFGEFVDAMARANPHRLHHVYEWNQCGDSGSRLFELKANPAMSRVVVTYEFLPSVTPNNNGQVFWDKAQVMESGDMVTNNPSTAVLLRDGNWRVGPFTFNPGGEGTTNAFRETFIDYFANRIIVGPKSIKASQMTRSGGYNDARRIYGSIISQ